jgi:hypothetical protein
MMLSAGVTIGAGIPTSDLWRAARPASFAARDSSYHQVIVPVSGLVPGLAKDAIVRAAKREVDRVIMESMSRSGVRPTYRQIVDGVEGAPFESVSPQGEILLAWQYLAEITLETIHALVLRGPYRSGKYVQGIIVMINGQEADISEITGDIQEVLVVASVNYARRLEVGRNFSKQVRPHIVQETALLQAKEYRKFARITYNYVDLSNAHLLVNPKGWRRRGFSGDATPQWEKHVRYPAIFIRQWSP